MVKARVIPAIEPEYLLDLPDRLIDQLDKMQQLIGGYVEAIPITPVETLWVNEDGQRLRLPANPAATKIAAHTLQYGGYIRGTAILTGINSEGELEDTRG